MEKLHIRPQYEAEQVSNRSLSSAWSALNIYKVPSFIHRAPKSALSCITPGLWLLRVIICHNKVRHVPLKMFHQDLNTWFWNFRPAWYIVIWRPCTSWNSDYSLRSYLNKSTRLLTRASDKIRQAKVHLWVDSLIGNSAPYVDISTDVKQKHLNSKIPYIHIRPILCLLCHVM